ncbi:MAG: hypothetical protein IJU52_03750 [Clostridia bacterium]|nr:hypothetical protein [Clostridia bacterium]
MKNPLAAAAICMIALLSVFFAAFPLRTDAANAPQIGQTPVSHPVYEDPDTGETHSLPMKKAVRTAKTGKTDHSDVPEQNAAPAENAVNAPERIAGEARSPLEITVALIVTLLVAAALIYGIVMLVPQREE